MTTENKHTMIDVDQDYTTTETEEKSATEKQIKTHIDNNKNIKETKLSDSSPDIMELLNLSENNNKKNKDDKSFDFDIDIDTINNLEYDDIEHITNLKEATHINNILNKTLELQKNELKSKFFNKKIIERLKNSLENEIEDASLWRFTWAKISTAMFCISEVLMIIQTALSFTAASYQILLISYLAGVIGVIGVVAIGLNRFGSYSKNQSTEKTNQLNKLLKTIGINDVLPDLMDDNLDKKNKQK